MADFDDFDDVNDVDVTDFEDGNAGVTNINEDDITHLTKPLIDDDALAVSEEDIKNLEDKASEINRNEAEQSQISFGRKMCPTRHGCQGATDCDYSYGSYPG